MPSVDYIWEKVHKAVICLAEGAGTFEERLYDAWSSALLNLSSNDPPADLADDLNWVLLKCNHLVVPGEGKMKSVDEMDRHKIVEKLIHILLETTKMGED